LSSFGMSGTNAHVIVEQAPGETAADRSEDSPPPIAREPVLSDASALPWVVSARSESALREQARRLAAHVAERPELELADVALSLAGRSCFEQRAALVRGGRRRRCPRPPAGCRPRGLRVPRAGRAVGRDGGRADRSLAAVRGRAGAL
jgi:acyl transferase domain-containing protein